MESRKEYLMLLGFSVEDNPSENEIKKAYKKLAMKYHPDRGGDELKFKEIGIAKDKLLSSEKNNQSWNNYTDWKNAKQMAFKNLFVSLDLKLFFQEKSVFIDSNDEFTIDLKEYVPVGFYFRGNKKIVNYKVITDSTVYLIEVNLLDNDEIYLNPKIVNSINMGIETIQTITLNFVEWLNGCKQIVSIFGGSSIVVKIPPKTEINSKTLRVKEKGLFGSDLYILIKLDMDFSIPKEVIDKIQLYKEK